MKKYEFINEKQGKISEIIMKNFAFLSYNQLQKMFRQKDIIVNGTRINKDEIVKQNNKIIFYCPETKIKYFDIIYKDENIIVVNKRFGIIVAEKDKTKPDELTLQELVEKEINDENNSQKNNQKLKNKTPKIKLLPYNRIDMNTSGLVVFCTNEKVLKLLQSSEVKKHYLAEVVGDFDLQNGTFNATLAKLDNKIKIFKSNKDFESYCEKTNKNLQKNTTPQRNKNFENKSNFTKNNFKKNDDEIYSCDIATEIKLIKKINNNTNNESKKFAENSEENSADNSQKQKNMPTTSLLEIIIEKGKTHQIRAHLAYLGFAIVGDNKYGKKDINKRFSTKKQKLIAYKLEFKTISNKLNYLNDIVIEIPAEITNKFFEK